jgi:hypothetical protein
MKRLAIATLLVFAAAAAAQEPARVTPSATSVGCVGQANDPDCATATFFACVVRRTAELCGAVGLDEAPRLVDEGNAVEWLIERASVIRERDVTDDLKHLAWFKAGNTLVEAQVRKCAATLPDCAAENWDDWQIYLAAEDGKFRVVGWRGDSEPDGPPEIPEAFRPQPPADPTPPAQ